MPPTCFLKKWDLLSSQEQLCEMDSLRTEAEQLRERNWLLQSQLDDLEREKNR